MRASRQERLGEQIRQEIAIILQRDFKDPRLGFVTVTRVILSVDASHAKVFFSCLGNDADRQMSQHALDHAAPFVHSLLKKRMRLRITPALVFHYDASIAGAIDMAQHLDQLREPQAGPDA